MRYTGYDESSSRVFFRDLRALVDQLGLIVVGLHPRKEKWLNLDELEATCECRPSLARTLHVRLYSREGYVSRWNTYFDWQAPVDAIDVTIPTVTIALGLLEQHSIRRCDAADGLGIDRSLFSKMLTGKRPLHEELVSRLQDWIKHRTPEIVNPSVTTPVSPSNCLFTSGTATPIMVCEQSIQHQRYEHLLLTPEMIARHGMNRITVYRALVDLERAGLVTVRRRRGNSPLVSIVADHLNEADQLCSQVGLNTKENT
jgi:DNA-binding transcriptional ArsR family regulator